MRPNRDENNGGPRLNFVLTFFLSIIDFWATALTDLSTRIRRACQHQTARGFLTFGILAAVVALTIGACNVIIKGLTASEPQRPAAIATPTPCPTSTLEPASPTP